MHLLLCWLRITSTIGLLSQCTNRFAVVDLDHSRCQDRGVSTSLNRSGAYRWTTNLSICFCCLSRCLPAAHTSIRKCWTQARASSNSSAVHSKTCSLYGLVANSPRCVSHSRAAAVNLYVAVKVLQHMSECARAYSECVPRYAKAV